MPKKDSKSDSNTPSDVTEKVLSTRQAADQLGVSVRTVQLWVESGMLAAWKTAGNHRRIYQWSVDELQAKGQTDDGTDRSTPTVQPSILIVEDDRTTQVYYESMFQMLKIDHQLHFTADGLEGLVVIGRHQPWLLLLDIDMPKMNGIEMIESLRSQALTEDLAMIVVSNVAHADALARGLPEDSKFFLKPISLNDLSETVAALFSERQQAGAREQ